MYSCFKITSLAGIASLVSLAIASTPHVLDYGNDNGHIAYEGNVSVDWRTKNKNGGPCDIKLGPQNHTWFYTGVHSDWDRNRYFFEINHVTSTDCDERGENCKDFDYTEQGGFFNFINTVDEIYNLNFYSSAYIFNTEIGDNGGEFEPQSTLDFRKATFEKTELDGEKGYQVRIGKDSWVNNFTIVPSVRLDYEPDVAPNYYDLDNACFLESPEYNSNFVAFEWNGYHDDFSVDYTFTNKKAIFKLFYTFNGTQFTLNFEGKRKAYDYSNTYHENPDVNLANFNAPKPEFEWVIGGSVYGENTDAPAPRTSETTSVRDTSLPLRSTQPTMRPVASTSVDGETSTSEVSSTTSTKKVLEPTDNSELSSTSTSTSTSSSQSRAGEATPTESVPASASSSMLHGRTPYVFSILITMMSFWFF